MENVVSDAHDLTITKEHIRRVFQLNGYPEWLSEGVDREGPMDHKPKHKFLVVHPFVKHVSEQ